MPPDPKLIDKLSTRLPDSGRALLGAARALAEGGGLRLFLVGGAARDLLLRRESIDVDIALEGDALEFARELATITGARLAKTTEFGTATLRSDDFTLDLATTRAETYARPGALPKVRHSTLSDDLLRRDFTINAVALELAGPAPGKLYDPTGGVSDIRGGLVRILHDRSFQDDATRVIRAVRYAARFGFRIEEGTLDLLARDLSFLDTISGARLRRELERTLEEDDAAAALLRLQELGVLAAVHPGLRFSERQAHALRSLGGLPLDRTAAWAVLAWETPDAAVPDLVRRLALTKAQSAAVSALPALRKLLPKLGTHLRPSRLDALLSPVPAATVLALGAMREPAPAARAALLYLRDVRGARPILRGGDIEALGVVRGPEIGQVLERLRVARLDGEARTRRDEERLVREYLARKRKTVA